jgi:hypothetical protein
MFVPARADARFCSGRCRVAAHRKLSVTHASLAEELAKIPKATGTQLDGRDAFGGTKMKPPKDAPTRAELGIGKQRSDGTGEPELSVTASCEAPELSVTDTANYPLQAAPETVTEPPLASPEVIPETVTSPPPEVMPETVTRALKRQSPHTAAKEWVRERL